MHPLVRGGSLGRERVFTPVRVACGPLAVRPPRKACPAPGRGWLPFFHFHSRAPLLAFNPSGITL